MTNHRQPTHHLAYNKILKPVVEDAEWREQWRI